MNISDNAELLDAAKDRLGLTSDYKLAQALNWRRGAISMYRNNRRAMDVEQIEDFARLTGIPVETVLHVAVCMRRRAKSNDRYHPEARAAA